MAFTVTLSSCKKETPSPVITEDLNIVKSNGQGLRSRKFVVVWGIAGCINTPKDCTADVIVKPSSAADLAFNQLEDAILSNNSNAIRVLLTSSPLDEYIEDSDVQSYLTGVTTLSLGYSENRDIKYFVFSRVSDGETITAYPVTK